MKRHLSMLLGLCVGLSAACDINLSGPDSDSGGTDGIEDDEDDADDDDDSDDGDDDDDDADEGTDGDPPADDGSDGGGDDDDDDDDSADDDDDDDDDDTGFDPEPGQCAAQASSCDQCLDCATVETCGEPLDACIESADCISLVDCYAACDDDPSCEVGCVAAWPDGLAAFNAMIQCLEGECGGLCV